MEKEELYSTYDEYSNTEMENELTGANNNHMQITVDNSNIDSANKDSSETQLINNNNNNSNSNINNNRSDYNETSDRTFIQSQNKLPIKVQFIDNKRGRGVIALHSFSEQECILAIVPTISVLYSQYASKLCAYCYSDVTPLTQSTNATYNKNIVNEGAEINNSDNKNGNVYNLAKDDSIRANTTAFTDIDSKNSNSNSNNSSALNTKLTSKVYRCPTCDQFVLCARCVQLATHGELGELQMASGFTTENIHNNDIIMKSAKNTSNTEQANPELVFDSTVNATSDDTNINTNTNTTINKEWEENATVKLEDTFIIKAHKLSCSWYNELPAAVRAPGQDTDMLRFCLEYGARVYYGDKDLQHSIMALDSNESALSVSVRQFCEIFARDRIVATFSAPYQCAGETLNNKLSMSRSQEHSVLSSDTNHKTTLVEEEAKSNNEMTNRKEESNLNTENTNNKNKIASEMVNFDLHNNSTNSSTKNNDDNNNSSSNGNGNGNRNSYIDSNYNNNDRNGDVHSTNNVTRSALSIHDCNGKSSLHAIRYPVLWEELNEVLMRIQCNSLGFPFNTEETTGWSLQDTMCMLNHSCVPNAAIVLAEHDGNFLQLLHQDNEYNSNSSVTFDLIGCMGLKALKPIRAGEEITISYINLENYAHDVELRQRHLLEQYRFLCSCPLCLQQRSEYKIKR